MRIRTVKPSFFLHDGLFDLEKSTRLPIRVAFIGLWCAADREGRFEWRPRRLKPCILPHDNLDFGAVLDALAGAGFIVRYGPNGEFGHIPSFATHQCINVRESDSSLPEPAPVTCMHVHAHASTCGREGNMEGNGKEGGVGDADARRVEAKPEKDPIMDIPTALHAPEFVTAWRRWIEIRKGMKKPKSWPALFNSQLEWLAQFGPRVAAEILNQSVRNGWQGLFPPKVNGSQIPMATPQTWQDEEAAEIIRFANRIEKGKA